MLFIKIITFVTFNKRPTISEKIIISKILEGSIYSYFKGYVGLGNYSELAKELDLTTYEFKTYLDKSFIRRIMFTKIYKFNKKKTLRNLLKQINNKIIEKEILR